MLGDNELSLSILLYSTLLIHVTSKIHCNANENKPYTVYLYALTGWK